MKATPECPYSVKCLSYQGDAPHCIANAKKFSKFKKPVCFSKKSLAGKIIGGFLKAEGIEDY